jgi:hypothetical protein
MKDYLTIEKGINDIINKLNKLKKTAKEVCIKFSNTRKRGKITKNKNKNMFKTKNKNTMNSNTSKGSQYNSYKSLKSNSTSTPVSNELNNIESIEPDNESVEPVSIESTPTPIKI